MNNRAPTPGGDEESAVAELRLRLYRGHEEIEVPDGLWERVRAPRSQPAPRPLRRRWITLHGMAAVAAAVTAVVVCVFVAFELLSPSSNGARISAGLPGSEPGQISVVPGARGGLVPGVVGAYVVSTMAEPVDPGATCSTGSVSAHAATTCVLVAHKGLHVFSVDGRAIVKANVTIQVCLSGPKNATDCTPWQPVTAGHTLKVQWWPGRDEPAGDYCAITKQIDGAGTAHTTQGCFDLAP